MNNKACFCCRKFPSNDKNEHCLAFSCQSHALEKCINNNYMLFEGDITYLENEIDELKERIEKMKCVENCKNCRNHNVCVADYCPCDKWELK